MTDEYFTWGKIFPNDPDVDISPYSGERKLEPGHPEYWTRMWENPRVDLHPTVPLSREQVANIVSLSTPMGTMEAKHQVEVGIEERGLAWGKQGDVAMVDVDEALRSDDTTMMYAPRIPQVAPEAYLEDVSEYQKLSFWRGIWGVADSSPSSAVEPARLMAAIKKKLWGKLNRAEILAIIGTAIQSGKLVCDPVREGFIHSQDAIHPYWRYIWDQYEAEYYTQIPREDLLDELQSVHDIERSSAIDILDRGVTRSQIVKRGSGSFVINDPNQTDIFFVEETPPVEASRNGFSWDDCDYLAGADVYDVPSRLLRSSVAQRQYEQEVILPSLRAPREGEIEFENRSRDVITEHEFIHPAVHRERVDRFEVFVSEYLRQSEDDSDETDPHGEYNTLASLLIGMYEYWERLHFEEENLTPRGAVLHPSGLLGALEKESGRIRPRSVNQRSIRTNIGLTDSGERLAQLFAARPSEGTDTIRDPNPPSRFD